MASDDIYHAICNLNTTLKDIKKVLEQIEQKLGSDE